MKNFVFLLLALLVSPVWAQQTTVDEYYGLDRLRTVRAASGALAVAETTTAITGLQLFTQAVVYVNITTATLVDGDDEVDFYIQTTYDDGTTWIDLANVHLATADNGSPQKTLIFISDMAAGVAQLDDPTEGTISDDTNADYPVGSQMRIKTLITGATAPTYAYTVTAVFWP